MSINADRARVKARQLDRELWEWLSGGLGREDKRLAIFDRFGERINPAIIKRAIQEGYAEPWFASPMSPNWTVCRLTQLGSDAVVRSGATTR